MLSTIVPETFLPLLAAFQPCFTAPSFRNFSVLVAGWFLRRRAHHGASRNLLVNQQHSSQPPHKGGSRG